MDERPSIPLLMSILNVTPDSFSDGGRYMEIDAATARGERMLEEGADIVDVGGESTRPGAAPVPAEEQVRRVVPVIQRLAPRVQRGAAPWAARRTISVDTTSARVAAAALDAGATIVNDVSAGRDDPSMFDVVAARGAGIVLMHRLVPPAQDSYSDRHASPPRYRDVVADVVAFLRERVDAAAGAGVPHDAICIDPGLGFGKSVDQNLELLGRTDELLDAHPRVLIGASRKSFLAAAASAGEPAARAAIGPAERLPGSLAAAVIAALRGAAVLRVHDVSATRQALAVASAAAFHRRSPHGSVSRGL
ncbi:MAG: dihydropteroate synthase [Phycisphaerales bacterium]